MRFLFVNLVLILTALVSNAQFTGPTGPPLDKDLIRVGKLFWLNTTDTTTYLASKYNGALMYRSLDKSLYVSDSTKWVKLAYAADGIDTASLSSRIDEKVNLSDTAAMLLNYLKWADTTSLSNRINSKVDSFRWLDSLAAQDLQRTMNKGNTTTLPLLMDNGTNRLEIAPLSTSYTRIRSLATGVSAFKPMLLATGGLMISDRSGSPVPDDGASAIQIAGNGRITGTMQGANATADNQFVTRGQVTDSLDERLDNHTIMLTGDVLGSGTTAITTALKSTGTAGTYTKVTTDAQGRVSSGTTLSSGDIPDLSLEYIPTIQKGASNGVAPLGSDGKVPAMYLPTAGSNYVGIWDASTNTPPLADGVGSAGDYYIVNVAGTQDLGSGNITFDVGDNVVYNGTMWQKVPTTNSVVSVNGKIGIVVIDKSDVGLSNVDNTSDLGKPISTATQTALNGKEATIAAGTTAQYWRGDKTWQTLSSAVRPLFSAGTGLTYNSSTGAFAANFGTAAGTIAQGNDSRIVNAVPNTRTLSAGAGILGGGDLTANRSFAIDPAYASFTNYYTKTNLQTGGQAAVHYGNLTNVPTSFPPSSGSANYIQNQIASAQSSSNFWITNAGISNNMFQVRRNGSNTVTAGYNLYNADASRGAILQLNGDVNPGLATWINTGSGWVKRQEYFADGTSTFYGSLAVNSNLSVGNIPQRATAASNFITSDNNVISYRTPSQVLSDISAAPASGSGNYIQAQTTSNQSASWQISGIGRIRRAGSNGYSEFLSLQNNDGTRGVSFQLNGDATPGLSMYAHNGTSWIERYRLDATNAIHSFIGNITTTGTATFAAKTLLGGQAGTIGSGTGTSNISYFNFYESDGTTRAGYVGKGTGANNNTYLVSDNGAIVLGPNGFGDYILERGNLRLVNSTSNRIEFNSVGIGAPTFITRSAGTKISLWPTVTVNNVDYGLGVEASHLWLSVPQNVGSQGFKFYGGTTNIATLSATGALSVNTSVTAPTITSPSSTDLNISSPQSIMFNPGGVNRGWWDNDGLGIGLQPNSIRASLLQVGGNVWANDAYILGSGTSPIAEFGLDGNAFIRTMGTQNLDFRRNADAHVMRIVGTNGNILINSTADDGDNKLQVTGTTRFNGAAHATGNISTSTTVTANVSIESPRIDGNSYIANIRTITASTSVTADDYTIISKATSGNPLITLPNPLGSAGRILVLVDEAPNLTANMMSFSYAGTGIFYKGATYTNCNNPTLASYSRLTIQSDGNNWIIISGM